MENRQIHKTLHEFPDKSSRLIKLPSIGFDFLGSMNYFIKSLICKWIFYGKKQHFSFHKRKQDAWYNYIRTERDGYTTEATSVKYVLYMRRYWLFPSILSCYDSVELGEERLKYWRTETPKYWKLLF